MQIYNTLTRDKETLKTLKPKAVNMYACGVTVYDYCHIGHARTYASIDVVVRYLRWRGYDVNYVRNITDVDDKIIKRAHENNEDIDDVTRRFIDAMHEDFDALGFLRPDSEPCATQHIPQMITLIERIIENGHAYVGKNGDVYFDVRSFADYGCLSHHNIEELESGARIEVSDVKRDPLDFVLWKLAKPGEPAWNSPWGEGRPGWHIECSAMSMELLGETFDIHLGGKDLVFPHHENEIAQSEAATHKKFANLWMHGGFLQINKEKMSKSLGNFITIRDVLQDHSAETLRYLLISSHYRSQLVYTDDTLHQAKQALSRLYTALRFMPTAEPAKDTSFEADFIKAMDDDFNTPVALSVLFELAHEVQRMREKNNANAAAYAALLKQFGGILGVLQADPDAYFKSDVVVDVSKIEALIQARQQARSEKNWAEADRIRKELAGLSVTIEDGPSGTTWKSIK